MFDVMEFQNIRTGHLGAEFLFFPRLESTNALCEQLARSGCREGVVVLAETQTAGKGRNGAAWFSPPDVNLYFTVVLRPTTERLKYLPYLTSLSLVYALEKLNLEADIKWPNDVLVHGRKIAGILVQSSMEESRLAYAVVGCGLNVNLREFPDDLERSATSIALELECDLLREPLLASILSEMERLYESVPWKPWDEFCRTLESRSSYLRDCEVRISHRDHFVVGTTCGLDNMGGLMLRTKDGMRTFYAGEIESCRRK